MLERHITEILKVVIQSLKLILRSLKHRGNFAYPNYTRTNYKNIQ